MKVNLTHNEVEWLDLILGDYADMQIDRWDEKEQKEIKLLYKKIEDLMTWVK